MDDWLRDIILPISGGVVAIIASYVFGNRITKDQDGVASRKSINLHAWYATGILSFLLICSLAIDLGSIPELATILSFAVGLASLILALIAIIQALTSTSSVEASLAAVRQVALDAGKSGGDLAVSIDAIREVAKNAQAASLSALRATDELTSLGSRVIRSSEEGRLAIDELRSELKVKSRLDAAKGQHSAVSSESGTFPNDITLGGATAVYTAIHAYKSKKKFSLKDIFGEDAPVTFESAYLSALDDLGFIAMKRSDPADIEIVRISDALLNSTDYIESKEFNKERIDEQHKENMILIKKFFSSEKVEN